MDVKNCYILKFIAEIVQQIKFNSNYVVFLQRGDFVYYHIKAFKQEILMILKICQIFAFLLKILKK